MDRKTPHIANVLLTPVVSYDTFLPKMNPIEVEIIAVNNVDTFSDSLASFDKTKTNILRIIKIDAKMSL
ncbi:MAG: hypothetical protein V4538_13180 [Bacteroidota bacterium]